MKVLFLFTPGPFGGAEAVVLSGIKALIKIDTNVELGIIQEERVPRYAQDFTQRAIDLGIPYRVFSCNGRLDLKLKSEIKSYTKTFDIIHAHGIKGILYGYLGKNKSTKLISTHHGRTSHTALVKLYEKIELYILKRSYRAIAVSKNMFESFKTWGIKKDISVLVENPLAIKSSSTASFENEIPNLLFIGRLSKEKGCLDLLQSLKHTKESFILNIIGAGEQEEALKDYIQKNDLNKKVVFHGFQKDVIPFILKADALIMPSHREGLPMALIEATALGLPVIASNVGGIPSLVKDQENGILFEPKNVDHIAGSIDYFIQNIEDYQKASIEKSNSIQEKYSIEVWAKKTKEIYTS